MFLSNVKHDIETTVVNVDHLKEAFPLRFKQVVD